jgi:hypothetical protein
VVVLSEAKVSLVTAPLRAEIGRSTLKRRHPCLLGLRRKKQTLARKQAGMLRSQGDGEHCLLRSQMIQTCNGLRYWRLFTVQR